MITGGQGPWASVILKEHRMKGSFWPRFKGLMDSGIRGCISMCREVRRSRVLVCVSDAG